MGVWYPRLLCSQPDLVELELNSVPIYMATSHGTYSRSQHLIHIVTGMPHAIYLFLAMLCWECDAFNPVKMSEALYA